jgi:hypothetical protein
MKRSAGIIGLTLVIATAVPVAAQQSLGDVAGSIKLNRPEGEPVVIDHNTVRSAGRARTGTTDVGFTNDILDDCLAETRALHGLVVEARDGRSFYRDGWRSRVLEVALRLDGARAELDTVRAEGRYLEAYQKALQGSETAGAALEIIRGAIAEDRPVFSEAGSLSLEAVRQFEEAQAAIGIASRADAAEDTPVMINPIEADRDISAVCRGRYDDDSDGFEECVAAQRSALDTLVRRSGPTVGLPVVDFNVIRNNCRGEWPGDFVHQDRCEQRRIAAKKPL